MKKNPRSCRRIIAVIGIALLMVGITRTSRADGGRAFADQSKFTKIDVPGAAGSTEPFGINPRGDVVGFYFAILNNNLVTRGFLLTKGTFKNIDVDVPGAVPGSTQAFGINPQGDIVGSYYDGSGNTQWFSVEQIVAREPNVVAIRKEPRTCFLS